MASVDQKYKTSLRLSMKKHGNIAVFPSQKSKDGDLVPDWLVQVKLYSQLCGVTKLEKPRSLISLWYINFIPT